MPEEMVGGVEDLEALLLQKAKQDALRTQGKQSIPQGLIDQFAGQALQQGPSTYEDASARFDVDNNGSSFKDFLADVFSNPSNDGLREKHGRLLTSMMQTLQEQGAPSDSASANANLTTGNFPERKAGGSLMRE